MKKLFALSCALLSLATTIPMMGCGSSSSDSPGDVRQANVSLVNHSNSRGIRIAWTSQIPSDPRFSLVEYQIVRKSVDNPDQQTIVGTATPSVTSFTDTTQERSVSFNNLPSSFEGSEDLKPETKMVSGLTPGTYTYNINVLYRDNIASDLTTSRPILRYRFAYPINETTPIRFE